MEPYRDTMKAIIQNIVYDILYLYHRTYSLLISAREY